MGSKLDPKTKAFVASSHYLQYDVSVVEIGASEGGRGKSENQVSLYVSWNEQQVLLKEAMERKRRETQTANPNRAGKHRTFCLICDTIEMTWR